MIAIPVPSAARNRLDTLLLRRRLVDQEIANFLAGILAAQGIAPERLDGLTEGNTAILVQEMPDAPSTAASNDSANG